MFFFLPAATRQPTLLLSWYVAVVQRVLFFLYFLLRYGLLHFLFFPTVLWASSFFFPTLIWASHCILLHSHTPDTDIRCTYQYVILYCGLCSLLHSLICIHPIYVYVFIHICIYIHRHIEHVTCYAYIHI